MKLDHINIRALDQEAMKDFLVRALGLSVGERPDFSFPGYWLYLDDQAIIHLQQRSGAVGGETDGWIDHIAFGPFDFETKTRELDKQGQAYTSADVPGLPLKQIFVAGPEGVKLELQCPTRRSRDS